MNVGQSSVLEPLNEITLEAWIYPTAQTAYAQIVGNMWDFGIEVIPLIVKFFLKHFSMFQLVKEHFPDPAHDRHVRLGTEGVPFFVFLLGYSQELVDQRLAPCACLSIPGLFVIR